MHAKSRQAYCCSARSSPKVQCVQRPRSPREKVLQVGKGEIEAEPAIGRLEIGGVFRCTCSEKLEILRGSHFLHSQAVPSSESRLSTRAYLESIGNGNLGGAHVLTRRVSAV